MREKTCCRNYIGYSFRLAAWVILCASSHRQDNTYHDICYTSRGALAGSAHQRDNIPSGLGIYKYTAKKQQLFYVTLCQAAVSIKISNLLICFDLSCPILEKDNVIENVYIVLSCLNKQRCF